MPESTPLTEKIAALNQLREAPDSTETSRALRDALCDRSNRLVAKAAELCGEFGKSELIDDLREAYQRAFVNPSKKDPGCLAKTAIASALVQLECQDIEPFRRGIKYTQYEPVWGGQADKAAELRAICAAGMVGCATCMEAITSFADLLVDPCKSARIGGVRAIAGLGRWEGVPLLRLKLQTGDADAEVMGACCAGLLHLSPDDSLELVVGLLSSRDVDVRIQVALALGESHSAQALEPLRLAWEREPDNSVRGILLTCIGLLRSTDSHEFLLSLIHGADRAAAVDAIRALAPFRHLEELHRRVERAVEETGSSQLRSVFGDEFHVEGL